MHGEVMSNLGARNNQLRALASFLYLLPGTQHFLQKIL